MAVILLSHFPGGILFSFQFSASCSLANKHYFINESFKNFLEFQKWANIFRKYEITFFWNENSFKTHFWDNSYKITILLHFRSVTKSFNSLISECKSLPSSRKSPASSKAQKWVLPVIIAFVFLTSFSFAQF